MSSLEGISLVRHSRGSRTAQHWMDGLNADNVNWTPVGISVLLKLHK